MFVFTIFILLLYLQFSISVISVNIMYCLSVLYCYLLIEHSTLDSFIWNHSCPCVCLSVCLSVCPSLSFLKIGSLVFSDVIHSTWNNSRQKAFMTVKKALSNSHHDCHYLDIATSFIDFNSSANSSKTIITMT